MERTLILDCLEKVGQHVHVKGWVQTIRKHGKIVFFDLKDRTGVIQIGVFGEEAVAKVDILHPQDIVSVTGIVKKREEKYINHSSPVGSIELELIDLSVLASSQTLPFDLGAKELHLELPTLLDNRVVSLRHPTVSAIFKVQETIVDAYRTTLKKEGFTEIFVPTIVPTATEGGAEVFSVDYYGNKAYLAQSPQLYKQMMVSIFERVFTVAHAYRAEPSVTTRHLSEYISLDAEFGFIESYEDLMDMAEKLVKAIISCVKEKNGYELQLLQAALPPIEDKFPRLTLREAQEIVFKRTGQDHRIEPDLDPADERELCMWAQEEAGTPFVFITHFPTKKRPFYTFPDPKNPEYTLSFDLLGVNEEWVTGGQRIHDYDRLVEHIKKWGNKKEHFQLYLQAFAYGMPPEGGFAMGLERMTKDLLGLSNVREASLFPRDMERVDMRLSVLSSTKRE